MDEDVLFVLRGTGSDVFSVSLSWPAYRSGAVALSWCCVVLLLICIAAALLEVALLPAGPHRGSTVWFPVYT